MDILGILPILYLLGIAIISILIIASWLIRRKVISLSYVIISRSKLIALQEISAENIKLTHNNQELKSLYQLIVRFDNTGNVPIEVKDFVSDITISCRKAHKTNEKDLPEETNLKHLIISTNCIEKSTRAIPVELSFESDNQMGNVHIKPMLLNPKDWFVIQITSAHLVREPEILSRIVGLSEILEVKQSTAFFQSKIRTFSINYMGYMALLLIFFWIAGTFFTNPSPEPSQPPSLLLTLVTVSTIFGISPFVVSLLFTYLEYRRK